MPEMSPPAAIRGALRASERALSQGQADAIGCSSARVLLFDRVVLKIEAAHEESRTEHCMLAWLAGKLPVPEILLSHEEGGVNYLLMTRLPGKMACDERLLGDPEAVTRMLAEGLRRLWAVDIADCPCASDIDSKLRLARLRVERGLADVESAEPATFGPGGFSGPEALLNHLEANRPAESLVLSHGDYCLPNVFLDGGAIAGFIDLGRSGTADKWQDIALCLRSMRRNFRSDAYGPLLLKELNIDMDEAKRAYYALLDELF